MSGNSDPEFWAKAHAHLVRYGGAFAPVIAESAAGNWFTDADGTSSVKDIRSGEQVPADPTAWQPPTSDLRPHLVVEGD